MSLQRLIQVSFLFVLAPPVIGFEGDEHRELSDLSLSIAVDLRCPQPATSNDDKCEKIREAAAALTNVADGELSYGDINQVVDYMHYPEMVFDANLYSNPTTLNTHVEALLASKLGSPALLDYLSASSHNERHFQADMMKSLDILHRAAINSARDGHIFRALVYNALSDHYLNDFFAPGHVTTQRENSHDMVAMAMHDWSNKAGTCFAIKPETWPELQEILEFIESRDEPLVEEIDEDVELANANLAECGNTSTFTVAGLSQEELQQKTIASLKDSHDRIYLKGDGRLLRNPKQKILMVLVQARSVSEVLDSYIDCPASPACNDPSQSVSNFVWEDSYEGGEIKAPKAKIRYGEYLFNEKEEELVRVLFFLPVGYRTKHAYPATADNGFLVSLGGQVLSHEPARFDAQLELFPMKIGSAWEVLQNKMAPRPSTECSVFGFCNVGFAFGLTYFRGTDFRATGGQFRAIKAFPKISGHLSANFRRGKYKGRNNNSQESWEWAYGIRYDHGFSMGSFYLGLQRDYGLDRSNSFGRENVVTFGVSIAFPSSRFLGLFGGYK